jgi:hypothetical protein
MTTEQEIAGLKLKLKETQQALATLIDWMAQSDNSPIRRDEASELINMVYGVKTP